VTDTLERDPFDDLPGGDPFADGPQPYPCTYASESELVVAAKEIMQCATCERAVSGDDDEPCPEKTYVTGCLFWKRRAGA